MSLSRQRPRTKPIADDGLTLGPASAQCNAGDDIAEEGPTESLQKTMRPGGARLRAACPDPNACTRLMEQREEDLRRLVGDRERLGTELLLDLQ